MLIKKFVGTTVPETMKKVKDELGAGALILDTRIAPRGDFCTLPDGNQVEITAAVDRHPLRPLSIQVKRRSPAAGAVSTVKLVRSPETPSQHPKQKESESLGEIAGMAGMTESISRMKYQIDSLIHQLEENKVLSNLPGQLRQLESKMEDRDFVREITREIMSKLDSQLVLGEDRDSGITIGGFKKILQEMVCRSGDLPPGTPRPLKLIFIGPSGDGKTTCLEKLVYELSVRDKRKVGILSLDTDRIGAIPSLMSYARILGVRCSGIFDLPELREHLEKSNDLDVVLFDTKGINPSDRSELRELSDWISQIKPDKVLLVLSATNRSKDLLEMTYNFLSLGKLDFIFTKLDQTKRYGGILSCAIKTKRPIWYLNWSASPPGDLQRPDLERIIDVMLQE